MLDATFCKQAETPHLIAAARSVLNPLTSTPLEQELIERLEEATEFRKEHEAFLSVKDEYEFTASEIESLMEAHPASFTEITEMLQALSKADINDLAALNDLLTANQE